MRKLKLHVPTYYGHRNALLNEEGEDFGRPVVPVLVHESEGIRLVLGSHDINDEDKPDLLVERRPGGWCIFLHPMGGGDPSGYVSFLDDGRSFVQSEFGPPRIQMLEPEEGIPELDGIPGTPRS